MAGGGADSRSVAEKLFAIADAFAGREDLSLSEIASRARLPLSTAHRLVGEWVEWGGLVRGDDGRYRVGMRLWRLGVRQPTALRLRRIAMPYLRDLLESTGEHVHLAVRDGLGAIYLERLSGPGAVPVISDVGSRLPLHATGVGLVLLAHAPTEVFDEVLASNPRRYLPNTLTDERGLRRRLAEIRSFGLSTSVEELTVGAFSVAAPVRDASGEVVAAVSIIAHVERVGEPQFALGVRMAARGVSSALGFRAPGE
ncbi:IclR family transcriptional regulator [Agromyces aurantiacus]|uniref:IclR family transcriptional regulator n=1 Tax=Agromyces aurantiacus TaxID=165814 RepID=A0ABV9R849_9MICO|nr:IclR family transcriptional regulator [Agromyces aurantiacus]MBM7505235.1 DNA-binding IclR family transcriptional regulator [Agromyces aurantiacus]